MLVTLLSLLYAAMHPMLTSWLVAGMAELRERRHKQAEAVDA